MARAVQNGSIHFACLHTSAEFRTADAKCRAEAGLLLVEKVGGAGHDFGSGGGVVGYYAVPSFHR